MKGVLKWAGYGLAGLAGAAVLAAGGAFAASEILFRMPQEKPVSSLTTAAGPEAVARGHRIAVIQGCVDCHGANLQGRMFDDEPGIATFYAPNLTLVASKATAGELDGAIRHGVGVDGRPLWLMPSSAFAHLTDAETADLVAYLKSLGPAGRRQPHVKVGPVGRLGILAGKFRSEAAMIRAHENPPLPDLGPQFAQGRSLARACVECHGPALKGSSDLLKTPDLMIAAAYEPEDFAKLMKTGIAAGGRQVGLMSAAARIRFQAFTPQEVSALYAYLKERADRQIADASAATLPRR